MGQQSDEETPACCQHVLCKWIRGPNGELCGPCTAVAPVCGRLCWMRPSSDRPPYNCLQKTQDAAEERGGCFCRWDTGDFGDTGRARAGLVSLISSGSFRNCLVHKEGIPPEGSITGHSCKCFSLRDIQDPVVGGGRLGAKVFHVPRVSGRSHGHREGMDGQVSLSYCRLMQISCRGPYKSPSGK